MAKYMAGPSRLWLTGRVVAVEPGEAFEHDFTVDGPEGVNGPDREAAMIASGAMTVATDAPAVPATTTASPGPSPDQNRSNRAPAGAGPAQIDAKE